MSSNNGRGDSGGLVGVQYEILPLLPVRNIVVYPFMILPLFVGRESSIEAVKQSLDVHNRLIVLAGQKDMFIESPAPEEIYNFGTLAMIMRERTLPDGRVKILIQGLSKVYISEFLRLTNSNFFQVKVKRVEGPAGESDAVAVDSLMRTARERLEKIISVGKVLSADILMVLEDIQDPGRLSDLIASNLNLKVDEGQELLETLAPIERLQFYCKIRCKTMRNHPYQRDNYWAKKNQYCVKKFGR
ncbi:MAG: LON peptidase substrate-binding domain-containing protein [Oligoflexia bacterium]|nr:LON peptidase substrate-binding domain-containing protein [Oligoflexia bacterium]